MAVHLRLLCHNYPESPKLYLFVCSEFQLIDELWLYVLSASQRAELILATPSTIHVFLSWIPLGFIFESPLLETLLKFIPVPAYWNLTLQCLTEVASLQFGSFYDVQYVKMYGIFMSQLQSIFSPATNIPEAHANDYTLLAVCCNGNSI
ncbi:protein EXPORTIN 1A [Trifolium repens]|nr:protein EXPORTIN 1A [Trifolium repens]